MVADVSLTESTGRCHRCGDERGTYVYGPMMHPGTYWCERCLVEEETKYARKAAAKLDVLEERLTALGGPAEHILCGFVIGKHDDDPTPFGAFCERDFGHEGHHEVARTVRRVSE
jgi:hypothetical protein